MATILIIDAGAPALRRVKGVLQAQGHDVLRTDDGAAGLRMLRQAAPDLLLLDAGLTSMDSLALCQALRQDGDHTPVLLVCASAEEGDRILGLEVGADDCVANVCCPREVMARVRALLRRRRASSLQQARFSFDSVVVDFRKRRVRRDGHIVALTVREFDVLRCLIEHRHEVMSRGAIWRRSGVRTGTSIPAPSIPTFLTCGASWNGIRPIRATS
jgi:DNA-binding response OmpR family regulator